MNIENSSAFGGDSEDDFDWEEVEVGQRQPLSFDNLQQEPPSFPSLNEYYNEPHNPDPQEGALEKPHIEITIQTKGKPKDPKKNERAVQLAAERAVRLECHKMHTVVLLVNARVRNKWINDPLLHARLMSITPLPLQNAFTTITKARVPEAPQRGRLFESAITRLADWWATNFQVLPAGHIRSCTFDEAQKLIKDNAPLRPDPKGKGKARAVEEDELDDEERYGIQGERIRSEKSLMKHALMREGSRDTSAQLFTALCRALGIPARLVVSLQSVPWQAGVGKPKPSSKKKKTNDPEGSAQGESNGKGKAKATDGDADEDDMEDVNIPGTPIASSSRGRSPFPGIGQKIDGSSPASDKGKGKQKAPHVIRLRKSKGGQKLSFKTTSERPRPRERTPDPTTTAPVFWTEVFSRADARWIPVDPVRVIVNKRKAFDPTPNPNASTKPDRRRPTRVENRMVYVLAFEEDGYARDVTPRYAREYGAKVSKVQQGGKGRREWWERILRMVRRPYRLQRDDVEDEELQANQMTEAMPTTMVGFKDHPLYVLARHLKREEVVDPLVELGKFRGESVYPRANVLPLKTAENWMRQGRTIIAGAQPLKMVKQRAVTVNKKRAIEMALADQRDRTTSASGSASTSVHGHGDDDDVLLIDVEADAARGNGEGFASEQGVMQGLYAEHQTALYRPPPVVDGKVPKNDFGNIDLYVPSMLPAGGAYIPYKGVAKLARQLGFDYAEAVTGFEFKKRRAFPIVSGVVVAAENESTLLEAYWEAEREAEAKRRAKREEQVIKRWTKLVHGLRIRQRLLEQYSHRGPNAGIYTPADSTADQVADEEPDRDNAGPLAGGFLTEVDDVVQPYALPRNLHEIVAHASTGRSTLGELTMTALSPPEQPSDALDLDGDGQEQASIAEVDRLHELTIEAGEDDDDGPMEDILVASPPPPPNGAPKTMQQLAEEAGLLHDSHGSDRENGPFDAVEEELVVDVHHSVPPRPADGKPSVRPSRRSTKNGRSSAPRAQNKATPSVRRARKRTRAQAEAEEPESEVGSEAGEDDAEDVREGSMRRAAKKARTRAPAPIVPASTRVLRTRKPKDADKIREEKEKEDAYRRAVAE